MPRRTNKNGECPVHGNKHMVVVRCVRYCAYPTPGEMFSKCFYHPSGKSKERALGPKIDRENIKPNVMAVIERHWGINKEQRARNV